MLPVRKANCLSSKDRSTVLELGKSMVTRRRNSLSTSRTSTEADFLQVEPIEVENKIKALLNRPGNHYKEPEEGTKDKRPVVGRRKNMSELSSYLNSKKFVNVDKAQQSAIFFAKQTIPSKWSTTSQLKPSSDPRKNPTVVVKQHPSTDSLKENPREMKTAKSSPKLSKSNNESRLNSIQNFKSIGLYQVPHKDFFVQSLLDKRSDTIKSSFEKIMQAKLENSIKLVFEEIDRLGLFSSRGILKLRLVVADSLENVIYLERSFSLKSLINSFIQVYLRTDRYAFGYSANNNELLVKKVLRFLEKVEQHVCVLRCRDEPVLIDKFSRLVRYIRNDCAEPTLNVKILDSNEVKLVKFLFFDYSPEFNGPGIREVEYADHPEDDLNNLIAPNLTQAGIPDESRKIQLVDDEDEGFPAPQPRYSAALPSIQKSKWMEMIEQCLANKDILYTNQDNFEKIFSKYPAKNKIRDLNLTTQSQNKKPQNTDMERALRFKSLISSQIQEERDLNVFADKGFGFHPS